MQFSVINGVNNKECLCFLEALQNCYAHTPVHLPLSTFLCAQGSFCEALAPVNPSGVCVPLQFTVFVHAPAPVHAFS